MRKKEKEEEKEAEEKEEGGKGRGEVRKAVLTPLPGNQGIGNLEEGPQHLTVLQLKRELKKYQVLSHY